MLPAGAMGGGLGGSPWRERTALAPGHGGAREQGCAEPERQVNERLLNYADDVVLLRRYLVDFGLLERTASGSSYRRPAGESRA